ncbi:MAG TPA: histone deacetylase [Vicinamibacteria bacterium]|jgi:acetoin utilization deacetylase AcuC-like enzyme
MRVGLYDDRLFREHDSGFGHPERPERLDALRRGLRAAGLEERLRLLSPRPATPAELLRVHTEEHLAHVASTRGRTVRFDADTQAGPRSYDAALAAAGAVVDAVDRVLDGDLDRAFCAVRPPGHHASADRAMGFCLFNNVAAGAAHAIHRGLSRVAVLDIDVHHGNGTQDIFWEDPRVLYVSSHAYPFYPGTGALDEVGANAGRGFTVNLPLPAGTGDAGYARVYRDVVTPVGKSYDPELVLVSCGFDAHRGDPLAGMDLSPAGFAHLMSVCLGVAGGKGEGRVVVALEGGYLLDGIANAGAAVVSVLLGASAPEVRSGEDRRLDPLLDAYREELRPFWPALAE